MLRLDSIEILKLEKNEHGYLTGYAKAARIGVQTYMDAQGNVVREFRPPSEVFSQTAQLSFRNLPLTNDHPKTKVNAANAKSLSIGHVGEDVRVDGDWLILPITITDEEAVRLVEGGKNQLSAGYDVDVDKTPGEYNGERYDQIQRKIRGNHVALVASARAGDEAKIRLDGLEDCAVAVYTEITTTQERVDMEDPKKEEPEKKDGEGMEKLKKDNEMLQKKLDNITAKYDELKGKMDEMEESKKANTEEEEKKDRADAVASKVSLITVAQKTGLKGSIEELARLDDKEIMIKAMVEAGKDPKIFEGKSDDYIGARFDAFTETYRADNATRQVQAIKPAPRLDSNGKPETGYVDKNQARQDHLEQLSSRHTLSYKDFKEGK